MKAGDLEVYPYIVQPKYRTKQINIVLLGGKARAGKTTAANCFYENLAIYPGLVCLHTAFATPLKKIASEQFGWDGEKDEKGRRLLQVIGTDAGRAYNEDIWVKHMDNFLLEETPHFAFIDDWRFPNEKSFYENSFIYNVISIRIERSEISLPSDTANHQSEIALPSAESDNLVYNKDSYYNFSIMNNGTVDEFYNKLGSILDYLKTKLVEY